MSDIIYRPLTLSDLGQMHMAFNEAFSDYQVNFQLDKQTFNKRFLQKLNISFPHSWGAFLGERLVGFIYHTINIYQNQLILYNGGTGVIPEYRGKRIPDNLFKHAFREVQHDEVTGSVLEVVTDNARAVKTYKKVGFRELRRLKCFKLLKAEELTHTFHGYRVKTNTNPDFRNYQPLVSYEPTFLDTFSQLQYNLPNEQFIEFWDNDLLVGFIAFQPHLGRISQIAVRQDYRQQGIGTQLISEAYQNSSRSLSIMNIDENEFEMISFLVNIGFENQLDQFEMVIEF